MHTSLQRRAIHTANHALAEADRDWIPVRRHWRLNERHYGDLQGKDKKQTAEEHGAGPGEDLAPLLRHPAPAARTGTTRATPASTPATPTCRRSSIPASECLKDVVERMLPYWYDAIVPDLRLGRTVLVAAHGNSLRALVKHLDGIADDVITEVNIPTGIPLVYELDDDLRPVGDIALEDRYLGGADAARAAAEAVAKQAG